MRSARLDSVRRVILASSVTMFFLTFRMTHGLRTSTQITHVTTVCVQNVRSAGFLLDVSILHLEEEFSHVRVDAT